MKPTESADPSPEFGGDIPPMRAGRLGVLGARTPETRALDNGPGGGTGQGRRRTVLPLVVVGLSAVVLLGGIALALTDRQALFPGGTVGWALALLTGIIVGHLVALGRDRWWGGTGSGAALTLGVLILYGWIPAGLVSLAVVSLVGAARGTAGARACCTAPSTSSASAREPSSWPPSATLRRSGSPGRPPPGTSRPSPRWSWSPSPTCSSPGSCCGSR